MNKLIKIAAPALGAIALIGAVQGTAQASTSATAQAVPSCVTYTNLDYWMDYAKAKVTNGCSTTQSFKLVYNFDLGTYQPYGCLTLAPGQSQDLFVFDPGFANLPMLKGLTTC
ncbi:hypothetical protein [Kitasatospora aureofaciens]|uniref:hypothetical protein n=1 Tax=Kitasatospora aureofaciens TaxID=1894 RepID=UPI001C44BB2B|nr:hypothetical protein [Kitasatospora aureofaciens]MBV6697558.1 hypothetical protein [Kitasatospora aureofaciens]